jgi:hypothetical protein
MKRFIRIQSKKNISVSAGLQSIDMSNRDAHVADRFNVSPAWTATSVLIKVDVAYYPAAIANWPAVKKLSEIGLLSFGESVDECPAEYKAYAEELEKKLALAEETYKRRVKQTLADPQATEKAKISRRGSLVKPAAEPTESLLEE